MTELVVATQNKKKLEEIKELLKDLDLKITSLQDYPKAPGIEEDGRTFEHNAIKKAATIVLYTQKLVLGEDSGLEVKVLKNAPGVFSARFSGPQATDKKNNQKLLRCLKNIPFDQRQARYHCCAALVGPEGIIGVAKGSCSGVMALRSSGHHGFGYDPLFFLPQYQKTFGQLDPAIKSQISHRARALKKCRHLLKTYLESHQK
jgi:XTP/dITP diphosphohydrolase